MGVSTKGVFHYTKSLDSLLNILSIGFYPSYCKEVLIYGKERYSYAIPMVSFCDIPLSKIQSHTKKYGFFAIGLTREWAKNNKLNPVVYIDKNSSLASGIKSILDFMFQDWHEWLNDKDFEMFYNSAYKGGINIIYSSKNYEGRIIRDGLENDFTFYDEREWRYIPQVKDNHMTKYPDIIWEDAFDNIDKKYPTKPHFRHYGLGIKAKDIKYLIIPDKSYLPKLVTKLAGMKILYDSKDEFNYLIANIMFLDRIKEDF